MGQINSTCWWEEGHVFTGMRGMICNHFFSPRKSTTEGIQWLSVNPLVRDVGGGQQTKRISEVIDEWTRQQCDLAYGRRQELSCDGLVGPDHVGLVGPVEELRLSFEDCRVEGGLQAVQFTCSVMSDSLLPHGLQHARLPCPSPTPGACSNSCPSSQWCRRTIYLLSSLSPPAFNLCQHQGLF